MYSASDTHWKLLARGDAVSTIEATGSTNTTGAKITAGTYFFKNSALCKAITDIATNATFTLNTNYEVVTVGEELSTLNSKIDEDTTFTDITSNILPWTANINIIAKTGYVYGRRVHIDITIEYLAVVQNNAPVVIIPGICVGNRTLPFTAGNMQETSSTNVTYTAYPYVSLVQQEGSGIMNYGLKLVHTTGSINSGTKFHIVADYIK